MMTTQVNSIDSQPSAMQADAYIAAEATTTAALLDDYFERAMAFHAAQQWQQAERYYQKILAIDSQQAGVNYNLGMLKWQTNARESSLHFFQQALVLDSSHADYWITYVDALMQTGQYAQARETLMRGIEHGLHGDEVNALVNLLSQKAAASVNQPAAQRINAPPKPTHAGKMKTYANNPKIRQAFALMQAGKLEQAKVKFNQLLKFYPEHALILSGLGSIALQQHQLDAGIQWLEKSLALDPNQTTTLSVLSVAYFQLKRFQQAVQCCDRAIGLNPQYAEAYVNRANAYQALNQHEQALCDYEQANALKPTDADTYLYLADYLNKHKQHARAENILKQGLQLKPNNAVMQTIYGEILLSLKRYDEALSTLNKAIGLDKHYFNAYLSRGVALLELKRFAEAKIDFQKALSLNANSESAYLNLAVVWHKQGFISEALATNQQALAINPKNISALTNHGLFLADDKQMAQAFAAFDAAIAADASDATSHWSKAIVQLLTGDFEQGWPAYEWRWQTILKDAVRHFSQPVWKGDAPLTGKTILIYPEQGLGDYIQFCRYASKLQALGAHVILEVPKALKALMQSLPGDFTLVESGLPLPAFDLQCPIMSLPLAFKTSLSTIPAPAAYLFADAKKQNDWAKKLGDKTKPRVGLVWSGASGHSNDHHRSIPLSDFQAILSPSIAFYVLQKEIRESDVAVLNSSPLASYTHDLHDFTDTAALIAQMDLVISVDTSVAHLAAAMGRPCWILLPYAPDFRWLLGRDDSPWYPSVKLFRQTKPNDWPGVIAQVKEKLTSISG